MARTQANTDREVYVGPTPERARIANGHLLEWASHDDSGRSITRYRISSTVYKMHADGRISDDELYAAEAFAKDFVIGNQVPGLTSKYGERLGRGGTPISQQSRATDSPEDRRLKAHMRYVDACRYLNHKRLSDWLTLVVCEIPLDGQMKPPTLAEVGKGYMEYSAQPAAQASGATLIKFGLDMLTGFYQRN